MVIKKDFTELPILDYELIKNEIIIFIQSKNIAFENNYRRD